MNAKNTGILSKMQSVIMAILLFCFYGFWSRLWFTRHIGKPRLPGPYIYAHWHGDELLLIGTCAWSRLAVMVSRSQDGEFLRLLLKWFGYHVVRGSSSRGGAGGLKGLIDAVTKDHLSASLAVDGPRGPIYQVKPGIIKLAQTTGFPIVAGASSAQFRFVFKKAWNLCYIPLPFSRNVIYYGTPLSIPKNASDQDLEVCRLKLERELLSLKREAENIFHRPFTSVPIPSPI